MSQLLNTLPFYRIAGWGFALNVVWEFGQCFFLYDMWGMDFWRSAVWMWGAVLSDVLIVLGVVLLTALLTGKSRLLPPDTRGYVALFAVGLVAGICLEWIAQALGLWEYSDLMPTLTVFGHTVGLSPIVQVTALPAASVFAARKRP